MTWHDLTPRARVLAMPHDEHPLAVADDLAEAAYLLRDVQACAEYDRTRWEVPK